MPYGAGNLRSVLGQGAVFRDRSFHQTRCPFHRWEEAVKVYWTAFYGRSEYTFQGRNAKRDALRLAKRFGGRVAREKGKL